MPATVTLDLLDTTDAGIAKFTSSLEKAGAASKRLAGDTDVLNRSMNRAEAERAKFAKPAASGGGGIGIPANAITAVLMGVQTLGRAFKEGRQLIREWGAEGYESFSQLDKTLNTTTTQMKSLADRAINATGVLDALDGAVRGLGNAFDFLSGQSQKDRDFIGNQLAKSKEYVQAINQKKMVEQAAADANISNLAEAQSKIQEQESAIASLDRKSATYAADHAAATARLNNLRSKGIQLTQDQGKAIDWLVQRSAGMDRSKELQGINNSIDANTQLNRALGEYRRLTADATATAEQRAAAQRKIAELEQKQSQLVKEESDWVKKANEIELNAENELWDKKVRRIDTEEEILSLLREERRELERYAKWLPSTAKEAEEVARKREQSLKRVQDLQRRISDFEQQDFDERRRREDAEMQARGKAHQEQLQQANERMKKALEERQAKINALAEQVKPAVAGIKANITDQQKIREMLRIRQERAKRGVLAANKGKPADDVNKKLREAERKTREQFAADLRRTRKPPRGRRTRDGRIVQPKPPKAGGPMARAMPIDPLEAEQATNDLVRKQIDNAANQGKFAGDTAAAIRAAADAQQKASETMVLHDQELQGLKRQLEAIQGLNAATNNNARQRAMGR